MTNALMKVPTNWLKTEKNGMTSTVEPRKMFQSKVGRGFMPRPEIWPNRAMTWMLVGAIQVIQLKSRWGGEQRWTRKRGVDNEEKRLNDSHDRAWKRPPGSQK